MDVEQASGKLSLPPPPPPMLPRPVSNDERGKLLTIIFLQMYIQMPLIKTALMVISNASNMIYILQANEYGNFPLLFLQYPVDLSIHCFIMEHASGQAVRHTFQIWLLF